MSEQGDGTGTGVWTHSVAEPRQPEQQRCECGACWWDGKDWLVRSCVETRDMSVCGEYVVQHCPGSCGCKLSVENGEPRVGEKYGDLERDAKRFRAVERAMGTPLDSPFNTHRWPKMTKDELMALRRVCPVCNGSGLWHEIYITDDGLPDEDGGACEICIGMGYVLPATPDVLELAGAGAGAGAALPPDPVAAVCSIVSHDCAVTIPQALMLLSKEYGLTTEQATTLLVRAARLRPACVSLERSTSASVVGYDSDERGRTITVDGYLRSHARIMPSRLAMAGDDEEADDAG